MNAMKRKTVLAVGVAILALAGNDVVHAKTPRLRIYHTVGRHEIEVYDTRTKRSKEIKEDENSYQHPRICRAGKKVPHVKLFVGRHNKYRFDKLQVMVDFYEAEVDRKRTVTKSCHSNLRLAAILTGFVKDLEPEPLYLDSLEGVVRKVIEAGMKDKTKDYVMTIPHNREIVRLLCIYDISADTIAIVDSLQTQHKKRERKFDPPMFDAEGNYLYYPKRESVLRYNLSAGTIDTIPEAYWPVIPYNSDDILVWDKNTEQLRLLNSDLSVRASIKADFSLPLDVFSIGEDRFVVSRLHYNKNRDSYYMKVMFFDFGNGKKRKLLETELGIVLDVELVD